MASASKTNTQTNKQTNNFNNICLKYANFQIYAKKKPKNMQFRFFFLIIKENAFLSYTESFKYIAPKCVGSGAKTNNFTTCPHSTPRPGGVYHFLLK